MVTEKAAAVAEAGPGGRVSVVTKRYRHAARTLI
jgi:hypothetical protein